LIKTPFIRLIKIVMAAFHKERQTFSHGIFNISDKKVKSFKDDQFHN
jgi:hypothetical protein